MNPLKCVYYCIGVFGFAAISCSQSKDSSETDENTTTATESIEQNEPGSEQTESSTEETDTTSTEETESDNGFILPIKESSYTNQWPLSMSDGFGVRILGNAFDFHRGMDFLAPEGTEVYAVRNGVVSHAGSHENYPRSGNFVVIRHDINPAYGEYEYSAYLHLSAIYINPGDEVQQEDVIGEVGSSGENINTEHLHFQYMRSATEEARPSFKDKSFDPWEVFASSLTGYDTENHSITFLTTNLADYTRLSFQIQISEPHDERDVNRIEFVFSIEETVIESIVVDENARVNCGTDDDTVSPVLASSGELASASLTIIPEDWGYSHTNPDISYDITYRLSGLDLSSHIGSLITLTVKAMDITGNTVENSTSFALD